MLFEVRGRFAFPPPDIIFRYVFGQFDTAAEEILSFASPNPNSRFLDFPSRKAEILQIRRTRPVPARPAGPSDRNSFNNEDVTMKKTALAALIAATLSLASVSFAQAPAEAAAPAAVPAPAVQAEVLPAVGMSAAIAEAEKTYAAKAVRANLRQTAKYGSVWCIRLVREDGTRVKAYIDAKTGKPVAADVLGIAPEGRRGPGCLAGEGPRRGHGYGHGPAARGHRGMHQPECPAAPHQPRPCMTGLR